MNNLQSTYQGFGFVNGENVFKVCDEPHPLLIKKMLDHCGKGNLDDVCSLKLKQIYIKFYMLRIRLKTFLSTSSSSSSSSSPI